MHSMDRLKWLNREKTQNETYSHRMIIYNIIIVCSSVPFRWQYALCYIVDSCQSSIHNININVIRHCLSNSIDSQAVKYARPNGPSHALHIGRTFWIVFKRLKPYKFFVKYWRRDTEQSLTVKWWKSPSILYSSHFEFINKINSKPESAACASIRFFKCIIFVTYFSHQIVLNRSKMKCNAFQSTCLKLSASTLVVCWQIWWHYTANWHMTLHKLNNKQLSSFF